MVEAFETSEASRRAFCLQRGIAVSTLDYWRRALARRPRLAAVTIVPDVARFALVLANGRRIECSTEDELARLIRIAERA